MFRFISVYTESEPNIVRSSLDKCFHGGFVKFLWLNYGGLYSDDMDPLFFRVWI